MSNHIINIDPIGVVVDEGSAADFDDLDSAGLAALSVLISGASDGSVWSYLDDAYLTSGASLGIPTNVAFQDDLIATPSGNNGLAWTDSSGDYYLNDPSTLMALDPVSGNYEAVELTTDLANPLILVGTTSISGNVAFIAVIDPSNLASDVYIFEYTAVYQGDPTDDNEVESLTVNVSVEADLSIGDFSDAVAGANQWNIVGKSDDAVQLLFTSDQDWNYAVDNNVTVNTNDFAIGSPSQDIKVFEMVRVDILAGGATSDIDLSTTETHDSSALELGTGHGATDEFSWELIQTGGSATNRVDAQVSIYYVDDSSRASYGSDAEYFDATVSPDPTDPADPEIDVSEPNVAQIDVINQSGQIVASWNSVEGLLSEVELIAYASASPDYASASYDSDVEISASGNIANINNVLVNWHIKTFGDSDFNRVEIFNDSDTISASGGSPKGSLGNKTFDVGAFVIGGSEAGIAPLVMGFADDAPAISEGADPAALEVDETDLTVDATGDFSTAFTGLDYGADGAADTNPLVYSLEIGNGGVSGLTDSATGAAVLLSIEAGTGDIIGTVNSGANEVVRVSVDASGFVTLNQSRAVLHLPNSGPDDFETFAAGAISFKATVTDKDFDDAEASKDISDLLKLFDDIPVGLSPSALFVENAAGQTGEAALGAYGNVGEDQDGYAWFVNGNDGDSFADFVIDAGEVGGLDDVFIFGFETDTLIATTNASGPNPDMSDWIFRMTLNPDQASAASDTVTIEMFQEINTIVNVPLDAETAIPSPGNPDAVILPDIGGSDIEARFTGWVDDTATSTTSQTTVNIKSDGVGVGTGQDFDVDGDMVDRLQLELFEDGLINANGSYDVGEERIVNDLVFQVEQNNSPNDDADMIVRAYDASGSEIQITRIEINGNDLVANGAYVGGVASNDDGGTVTASAAGLGWDLDGLGGGNGGAANLDDNDFVLIGTESGFFRIDIVADGSDANKDTFDILLETLAVPLPNDIEFGVDAMLFDEDDDPSPASTINVTLDYDGIA